MTIPTPEVMVAGPCLAMPAASRSRLAESGLAPMSSTSVVRDQAFPDRPVRIIDPFGAGGGVDVIARALARRLAAAWGQPADRKSVV